MQTTQPTNPSWSETPWICILIFLGSKKPHHSSWSNIDFLSRKNGWKEISDTILCTQSIRYSTLDSYKAPNFRIGHKFVYFFAKMFHIAVLIITTLQRMSCTQALYRCVFCSQWRDSWLLQTAQPQGRLQILILGYKIFCHNISERYIGPVERRK